MFNFSYFCSIYNFARVNSFFLWLIFYYFVIYFSWDGFYYIFAHKNVPNFICMNSNKSKSPKNVSSDRGARHNPRKDKVNSLTIHLANVRGLVTNKNCTHQHLESRRPDILVLTETKVYRNTYENEFYFKRYLFERRHSNSTVECAYPLKTTYRTLVIKSTKSSQRPQSE